MNTDIFILHTFSLHKNCYRKIHRLAKLNHNVLLTAYRIPKRLKRLCQIRRITYLADKDDEQYPVTEGQYSSTIDIM